MKRNNNQWAKYVVVVLTFVIMAGFFLPGAKAEVKATEDMALVAGESVSGGNVVAEEPVMTELDSWSIKVNYVSEGVIINSGSASGTPDSGATIEIPSNMCLTKSNWTFEGWSYEGKIYEVSPEYGNSIWIGYDQNVTEVTLVAQWRANPALITYTANGTVFAQNNVSQEDTSNPNLSIKIIEDIPIQEGFIFNGWLYKGNIVTADTVFSWEEFAGGTIDLEADWIEDKQVRVNFKSGDMDVLDPQLITNDRIEGGIFVVELPDALEQEGMVFEGWICDAGNELISSIEGNIYTFLWDKCKNGQIINFAAKWWDGKSIAESGKTYSLTPQTPYILGGGNWTINNDEYTYYGEESGTTFYVGTEGNYTFTKN